jgi:hypothetical protein
MARSEARAAEHIRLIAIELEMAPIRIDRTHPRRGLRSGQSETSLEDLEHLVCRRPCCDPLVWRTQVLKRARARTAAESPMHGARAKFTLFDKEGSTRPTHIEKRSIGTE